MFPSSNRLYKSIGHHLWGLNVHHPVFNFDFPMSELSFRGLADAQHKTASLHGVLDLNLWFLRSKIRKSYIRT